MSLRKSTNVQHISYPSFISICKSIKGYETELVYVIDCFQCWYTAPVQSSGNLITFCVRWKCSNQTLKFVISQSVHLSLCLIHKQHGCEISYTKRCLHKAVCPVCKWACVCVCVCLFTWCAVVTFPLCSNSPDVRAALFFCPAAGWLTRSLFCVLQWTAWPGPSTADAQSGGGRGPGNAQQGCCSGPRPEPAPSALSPPSPSTPAHPQHRSPLRTFQPRGGGGWMRGQERGGGGGWEGGDRGEAVWVAAGRGGECQTTGEALSHLSALASSASLGYTSHTHLTLRIPWTHSRTASPTSSPSDL